MAEPFSNPFGRKRAAITTLSVVNCVLGGLALALSAYLLWLGLRLLGAVVTGHLMDPPPATEPATPFAGLSNAVMADLTPFFYLCAFMMGFLLLAVAAVSILIGALLIVAGRGVLRRRCWARRLTLVLGSLGGLLAVLFLILVGCFVTERAPFFDDVAISLVGFLVHGVYCVLALTILLKRRVAAEFV